jgi:hypothetical protein
MPFATTLQGPEGPASGKRGRKVSQQPRPYTKIEEKIRAKLAELGQRLDPITHPAWYFIVNFQDLADGQPIGRLLRYEEGNLPFEPVAHLDIPGRIVGDVRIADGRAYFDGNGYVEFQVTTDQRDQLFGPVEPAKLEVELASPKDLVMIGHGHISQAEPGVTQANPVLYVKSAGSEFGLFAPDGAIHSKVNVDECSGPAEAAAIAQSLNSVIWFAYISKKTPAGGAAMPRWVHEIIDPNDILTAIKPKPFDLSQHVEVRLEPGTTFTIGGAPDAQPFKGWLEEVIFDPTGGGGSGRGG